MIMIKYDRWIRQSDMIDGNDRWIWNMDLAKIMITHHRRMTNGGESRNTPDDEYDVDNDDDNDVDNDDDNDEYKCRWWWV